MFDRSRTERKSQKAAAVERSNKRQADRDYFQTKKLSNERNTVSHDELRVTLKDVGNTRDTNTIFPALVSAAFTDAEARDEEAGNATV